MVNRQCPQCAAVMPTNAVVCPHDETVLYSPENDPLIGQLVGGYKVLKRLGIGGMGAVYEAVEPNIEKRVALKIVHPHLSADPRLPTLLAEAKAVNAIGDEGIIDIYGSGTLDDGRSFLVMELLVGESLEGKLQRLSKLGVRECLDVIIPLLQALEAAHAAGFVHRDIKAANVFIVERPHRPPFPKLLDFGIAQRIRVQSPDALGTPGYIAPEQAANVDVGAKADLYALGCLMFETLTGRLPFTADRWQEVMRLHREAKRPHLRDTIAVPEALDVLVHALMSVEPERRPASVGTVRAELVRIREALEARAESGAEPQIGWKVVASAILGVAALSVAAFLLLRPGPTDLQRFEVQDRQAQVGNDASGTESVTATGTLPTAEGAEFVRMRLVERLRTELRDALARGEAEAASQALAQLKMLRPDFEEPLEAEVKRAAFAHRQGMARVGSVYVDRYEYPNRPGALPATRVDWAEAVQLCESAGKHLCTETEWEMACRGSLGTTYPWGAAFEAGRCFTQPRKVGRKSPQAVKSGSFARCVGPEGVFDLIGNVAEWTATAWREGSAQRVIRGGSFAQSNARLPCDARDYLLPGFGGAPHLGFRCCL